MTQCIALLRGINVGRAKRIAMADLRTLVEELGFRNVKTLLNSGNVVFDAARPNTKRIATTIGHDHEAAGDDGLVVIPPRGELFPDVALVTACHCRTLAFVDVRLDSSSPPGIGMNGIAS